MTWRCPQNHLTVGNYNRQLQDIWKRNNLIAEQRQTLTATDRDKQRQRDRQQNREIDRETD